MFITLMKNLGLNMYIGNKNKNALMKEPAKIANVLSDVKVVKFMDKDISAHIGKI